jgi:hypothetical protein
VRFQRKQIRSVLSNGSRRRRSPSSHHHLGTRHGLEACHKPVVHNNPPRIMGVCDHCDIGRADISRGYDFGWREIPCERERQSREQVLSKIGRQPNRCRKSAASSNVFYVGPARLLF